MGIEIFAGVVTVIRPMFGKRKIDGIWLVGKEIFFFRRPWLGEERPSEECSDSRLCCHYVLPGGVVAAESVVAAIVSDPNQSSV